jgi:ubiquinone/menaquinone biosynthesis C-methylase UbiE
MSGSGGLHDYNHAERRLWQDAPDILARIGLKSGDTLADIGSGDGYFSIPAAQIVAETGMVYAIDVNAQSLEELKAAARAAGLKNIKTIQGNAEDMVLCERCADYVLMANVLHDFADPGAALASARVMLKPGGKLIDLDWKKEKDQLHGPPFAKRFDEATASRLMSQAGFKILSNQFVGPFHYLITAIPV